MTHNHGHGHGHSHSHNHSHTVANYDRAFGIGIFLNMAFVLVEAGFGIKADALALIADAGHNLSDVASLLLAWGASILARKAATKTHTYGFRKATVLASMVSAIMLLSVLGAISWEAIGRFLHPEPVESITMIVVAAIGVIINTLTALLFVRGQQHDLNLRGAYLHMAADAAVSLGVVVAGVLIMVTGWSWLDPAVSLAIVVVIFYGTWALLRDSTNYAIDAVPGNIDSNLIRQHLLAQDRVIDIHDLHIWPLSTTEVALTVHIIVRDENLDNSFLWKLQQELHDQFGIEHATIQIETMTSGTSCRLDREQCQPSSKA